jgi:hypothetical protein
VWRNQAWVNTLPDFALDRWRWRCLRHFLPEGIIEASAHHARDGSGMRVPMCSCQRWWCLWMSVSFMKASLEHYCGRAFAPSLASLLLLLLAVLRLAVPWSCCCLCCACVFSYYFALVCPARCWCCRCRRLLRSGYLAACPLLGGCFGRLVCLVLPLLLLLRSGCFATITPVTLGSPSGERC